MRTAIARFASSGVLLVALCMQTACQPGAEVGLFASGSICDFHTVIIGPMMRSESYLFSSPPYGCRYGREENSFLISSNLTPAHVFR